MRSINLTHFLLAIKHRLQYAKHMRKITIPSITLATLLCLSTNSHLTDFLSGSVFGSPVYAATKSAISPEIMPEAAPAINPAINPVINPAINLEPSAPSSVTPGPEAIAPINNAAPEREGIQIKIESNSNMAVEPLLERPVEVVLENRATGCKFTASSLLERDADLCNPEAAIAKSRQQQYQANNYDSSVIYTAAAGETSLQVRRLTPKEIAAMSIPSNGDKKMLFPLIVPSIISSIFGERVHPITGQVSFHQGTDLAAPEGTPVVAAFSGRVEVAGWAGGYGLMVSITHGDTHETRYAHLSEVLVKSGQEIKQGTVIGLVGSTGMSTGPHLHFEIWKRMQDGFVAIDPTSQLILAMENLQKYLAQTSKAPNKA
ncbi:M23 family metallopeptidase [Pseudanabaena sp. FACHB-1277]|uniref:M23 family metallopeptidase n=2 Tax=Pseudanabaena TaxID=1152 RepID=A0A926Z4E1_9CYAN|nr:M23 family metallopeptidase [Pseudanabaena cinerea FACHB-1277]